MSLSAGRRGPNVGMVASPVPEGVSAVAEAEARTEKVPTMQAFYDDIFLIFLLSALISILSYTVWGLMEISAWRAG